MKLISNNQREARELYLDPLRVWVYANIEACHPDTLKIRCWAVMGLWGLGLKKYGHKASASSKCYVEVK